MNLETKTNSMNENETTQIIDQQPTKESANMGDKQPEKPKRKPITKKMKIVIVVVLLILFGVLGIGGVGFIQAKAVGEEAKRTEASARLVYDALKTQDLVAANQEIQVLKEQVSKTDQKVQNMKWVRFIPLANRYWNDGDNAMNAAEAGVEAVDILVKTIEPYADVLGFEGQGSFMGGTAEDRIVKIVETLDKIMPQLDVIAGKLEIVNENMSAIDSKRYQFSYQGRRVDELIVVGQEFSQDAYYALTTARPAVEVLPDVLAVEGERKYMVLFQNDAELRATGGFMTAYGILRVEKGKIFQEKSEDIYSLDNKYDLKVPVPELIKKYLPLVFRQYIRDINLSPDFMVSMDAFYEHYEKIPGEPDVDGIIAVDTQVLNDIIDVLGPIEVPGYGVFSSEMDSRCDCPQVIYELELLADRPTASLRENRKGVLAPMLQAILNKAYGTPKQLWPQLLEVVIRNISEKHVLFYMKNEAEQNAAEQINIAGRIREFDGDYLHLNDINFAGAKSNMFTTQQVEQLYEVSDDGTITKTVTVKYQNPFPASNCNLEAGELCLNGTLRNVVRLYVPLGSELVKSQGSEEEVDTKEELGKKVFEGFFTLQPKSQAKIVFTYTLPMKYTNGLMLMVQKQPGTKNPKYIIDTPDDNFEFDLTTDKELILK